MKSEEVPWQLVDQICKGPLLGQGRIVRQVLAAAMPELRAQFADEVEAMCPTPGDEHAGDHCDFRAAAQAIRGGQ